jgi:hypothetical protein
LHQIINAFFAVIRFDGCVKRRLACNVIRSKDSLLNRFIFYDSTIQRITLQPGFAFRLALAAGLALMDAANQLEADL